MTCEVFVWAYLPGDVEPTLSGRFENRTSAAGGTGVFVYDTSYLRNPSALALDPIALPLRRQRFTTTLSNGIFGSLLDAMPDAWGRTIIDSLHLEPEFPARYMLHTAGDAVGNIVFSTSNTRAPVPKRPIGVEDIRHARSLFHDRDSYTKVVTAEELERIHANTGLGGARPKLTVEKDGRLWLAKFPSRYDDPRLPVAKVEAAMLDLARRCGIDAAAAHVVHDDVLLVERFDRGPVDGNGMGRRDGFLSARTFFECTGFRSDYGGSYVRLASELARYSCQSAKDQAQLFRRMVFNGLISNTDDHDRNHGLVADDMPGTYRLSPAFDLVPQLGIARQLGQAMNVGSGGSLATKENLLSECEAFGLQRHEAEAVIAELAGQVAARWRDCLVAQGLTDQGVAMVEDCFSGLANSSHRARQGRRHE